MNENMTGYLSIDKPWLKYYSEEAINAPLPEDYGKKFVEVFVQRIYPYDTLESIEVTRFHDKEELKQRDAFSHLDKLIPSRENAFLWRKR